MLPRTSDMVHLKLLQSLLNVFPCVSTPAAGETTYLLGQESLLCTWEGEEQIGTQSLWCLA